MKDTSGSAFPSKRFAFNDEERDTMGYCAEQGMTLRDYFAGKALEGILAGIKNKQDIRNNYHRAADEAYGYADAMLTERLK